MDMQMDGYQLVQSMTPEDTANYKFNGIVLSGGKYEFSITLGGSLAFYASILEETQHYANGGENPHYRNIEDNIVPSLVAYLDDALNNRVLTKYGLESISGELENSMRNTRLEKRESVLQRSLSITGSEYLYR